MTLLTAGTAAPSAPVADAAPAVTAPAAAPAAPAAAEPAAETAPATDAPASSEVAAEGAPETYADFALPEGVSILPEHATEIATLAKDLGLTQDNAQRVVDVAGKLVLGAQQQQAATVATLQAEWRAACSTDKEFGGEKLDENLARAKAALEATATPQLQVLLDKSGLGNHPEVIRHFLKVAPAFLQDTALPGGKAPTAAALTQAQRMFPNMNP